MSDQSSNRVLGRLGARVISTEETDYVNGGAVHTLVCTAILAATGTVTGPGDGDGCSDTDRDAM
jgi:hypothetical protein